MVESKLVQLNFENNSYIVYNIILIYVLSMLSLGHILISDLVVANPFMHSLPDLIPLYLAALFKPGARRNCFCPRTSVCVCVCLCVCVRPRDYE